MRHQSHLCKHGVPVTAGCVLCAKDNDSAKADGVKAAKAGIGIDACPHQRGTPKFHAWCDGHRSVSEKK